MDLAEAKTRLSIPDLWHRLELPGEPKVACRSPFREDRCASFSVSPDGLLFNDFATGEAGDAIDFLRIATGLPFGTACKRFLELAGGAVSSPLPVRQTPPASPQVRQKPSLPMMRRGTATELEAVANLRAVSRSASILANGAGLLRFATWKAKPAWIVTDDDRLNAQARRMDGEPWEEIGAKAQTLPGSWASWPIGAKTGANYPAFILCEGAPDLLAGLHFIHLAGREADCFPVAMLGAGMDIHPEALEIFAGKRIRIMRHLDSAGAAAAERWATQLEGVGADTDWADFSGLRKADGSQIKDLNDATQIHPEDAGDLEGLLP